MVGVTPRPAGTVTDLADAVRALREELSSAMAVSTDEDLRFEVGTVTMEFAVAVTADTKAHAGVKFWVVDVGAEGGLSRLASHTVTLELTPKTSTGERPEISDEE
jgi:hypothetical protein